MILTLLALLVLVALPLYLWRRPKPVGPGGADAGRSELPEAAVPEAGAPAVPEAGVAIAGGKKLTLAEPKVIRCSADSGRTRALPERCDRPTLVEDGLARSIRDNVTCAPQTPANYTVSFVLSADFARKKTHLWAGRSGTLRRRGAADLLRCVERSMGPLDWERIPHQYARYDVNVLATYQVVSPPPLTPQ